MCSSLSLDSVVYFKTDSIRKELNDWSVFIQNPFKASVFGWIWEITLSMDNWSSPDLEYIN